MSELTVMQGSLGRLRKWIRATREEGLGPMGTDLDMLRDIADVLEAEISELEAELKRSQADAKMQRNNFEQATNARESWRRKLESLVSALAEDHGLKASWDGLRGVWNVEVTEEHMNAMDALAAELADMERTHMRLPVDADGVPIKPGERLTFEMNDPGMCTGYDFLFSEDKWMLVVRSNEGLGGCRFLAADKARHVQPDTVESLLEEFAAKASEDTLEANGRTYWRENMELLAEYAERIRRACNG